MVGIAIDFTGSRNSSGAQNFFTLYTYVTDFQNCSYRRPVHPVQPFEISGVCTALEKGNVHVLSWVIGFQALVFNRWFSHYPWHYTTSQILETGKISVTEGILGMGTL
jgi:hypothetical protein